MRINLSAWKVDNAARSCQAAWWFYEAHLRAFDGRSDSPRRLNGNQVLKRGTGLLRNHVGQGVAIQ
jgi:hypothetical protein